MYRGYSDDGSDKAEDEPIALYKKQYRELFGMTLEIPAFYVLEGKFYPSNTNFQILIVKYQMPEKS